MAIILLFRKSGYIAVANLTYTILLGGDIVVTPRLHALINPQYVIAADSGMRHASTLDLVPRLWVGDFDSSDAALQRRYDFVERVAYPVEKALTDGEIAIQAALDAGADRLILCGALGGRTDQVFGHMTMAIRLAQTGIDVCLTSGDEEGYPLHAGTHNFDLPPHCLFSLVGFSTLESVGIKGAKWCLDNATLPFGYGTAISNVTQDAKLQISIGKGEGMLLANICLKT